MSYSGVDIWTQPNFSAGLPQELWQMNARGNAEFQQLYEAAYDQARRQGLAHDLAQDTAMRAARGIQGTGGMPDVWGDQRTVNLGGGLRRPVYPGAPRWSFEGGGGLSAEEARRSRMTEQLVVEARNNALAARRQDPLLPVASVQQATPASASFGRAIGVDDGLGFDPLALAGGTSGANAAKIDSTLSGLQQQPQRAGSGGAALDPLSAGLAAADMAAVAGDILPLTQGVVGAPDAAQAAVQGKAAARGVLSPHVQPGFAEAGGRVLSPARPHIQPGFAESGGRVVASRAATPSVSVPIAAPPAAVQVGGVSLDFDIPEPVRPYSGPDLSVDTTPNVSGGGPGTSTAKGQRSIARQKAARSGMGKGFLSGLDSFVSEPGQSVGVLAEDGVRRAAAGLHSSMPRTARMLRGLAPAARWAAPVGLFAATTALPAAMGAMEGNEKAGAGGAVLQGGSALAGAAIGQALIPIPVVGAGIGAMVGNAVGGGLTSGAQALAEESQKGTGGLIGGLGAALDPFIDTSFEREQKAVQQQMNSPAVRAIQQQEALRREQARTEQVQALYLQSLMR